MSYPQKNIVSHTAANAAKSLIDLQLELAKTGTDRILPQVDTSSVQAAIARKQKERQEQLIDAMADLVIEVEENISRDRTSLILELRALKKKDAEIRAKLDGLAAAKTAIEHEDYVTFCDKMSIPLSDEQKAVLQPAAVKPAVTAPRNRKPTR